MNGFSWLWDWVVYLPDLLPGLWMALFLTAVTCVIGYPLGFALALLTEARNPVVRWIAVVYVEIGRGIPALVLLYLVYRGLPQLGVLLDAVPSALVAFIITASAYSTEMFRSSIAAVPRGQFQASDALALSRLDTFRFVVLPQAGRIALPPLANQTITIFHITSLASVITVAEVMHDAYISGAFNWQYMSVYTAAAVLYAAIAIPGGAVRGASREEALRRHPQVEQPSPENPDVPARLRPERRNQPQPHPAGQPFLEWSELMKRIKRTTGAVLALASAAAVALTGCSSGASASTVAADCKPAHEGLTTITKGTLTVANYDYPPFSYMENGKLAGVEGEVMQKIADNECLSIKLVTGDSSAMITSVQTGRADTTLGSWYRTKKRSEVVRLSQPVISSPMSVVSTNGINTLEQLMQEPAVGAGQALVGADELQGLLGAKLKLYANDDAQFADLKAGRTQAVVLGYGAALAQLKKNPVDGAVVKPLSPDERWSPTVGVGQTNFPVNKDNDALGKAIDENIDALRKDGTLKQLAEKYGFDPSVAEPGEPNLL